MDWSGRGPKTRRGLPWNRARKFCYFYINGKPDILCAPNAPHVFEEMATRNEGTQGSR